MWPRPTINIIEIELIHCEKFPGVIGTSTVAKEMIDYQNFLNVIIEG